MTGTTAEDLNRVGEALMTGVKKGAPRVRPPKDVEASKALHIAAKTCSSLPGETPRQPRATRMRADMARKRTANARVLLFGRGVRSEGEVDPQREEAAMPAAASAVNLRELRYGG